MTHIHRPNLTTRFRDALSQPSPGLVVVHGPRGSGKSRLLRDEFRTRRKAGDSRAATLGLHGSVGPTRRQVAGLGKALAEAGILAEGSQLDSWIDGFTHLVEDLKQNRVPRLLAIDDVHNLSRSSPEFDEALGALWAAIRAHALPLHIVVASFDRPALEALTGMGGPFANAEPTWVSVADVTIDDLRAHLPSWSSRDRFLLAACVGRSARALGQIDPDVRWSTNVQRLIVSPGAPLHGLPPLQLQASVQKPDRYAGILSALAEGGRAWADLYRRDHAFTSGNQLGPYLSALQKLGWVSAEGSLDAPLRSRKRRYRLTDPATAFWYGAVEPVLGRLLAGYSAAQLWRSHLAPIALRLAGERFPFDCRTALLESGDAWIGARAREAGGLWGEGYDLPVAGTLLNGATFYGVCVWGRPATRADADAAFRQMRATRYGYGRATRWRVVLTSQGATESLLRKAARDELLTVLPLDALF